MPDPTVLAGARAAQQLHERQIMLTCFGCEAVRVARGTVCDWCGGRLQPAARKSGPRSFLTTDWQLVIGALLGILFVVGALGALGALAGSPRAQSLIDIEGPWCRALISLALAGYCEAAQSLGRPAETATALAYWRHLYRRRLARPLNDEQPHACSGLDTRS